MKNMKTSNRALIYAIWVLIFNQCYAQTDENRTQPEWRGFFLESPIGFNSRLFERYTSPKDPEYYEMQYGVEGEMGLVFNAMYIGVYAQFDLEGCVDKLTFHRLLGVGNDLSANDTLWSLCEKAILDVSPYWQAKPILWPGESFQQNLPGLRPNYGRQSHYIIMKFFHRMSYYTLNRTYFLESIIRRD